ncbi:MAG: cytochrome c3 family protein [Desulfobulbaceae bacterium]
MRKTLVAQLALAGTIGLAAALTAGTAGAATCDACHTMHNSQDGAPVYAGGPQPKLLNNDCLGCHTGANDGTSITDPTEPPKIYNTAAPSYGTDTLAGGNFYWVTLDDATGHNVAELGASTDVLGNTPPGHTGALASQLTCAGVYGCHGERTAGNEDPMEAMKGAHHFPHNNVTDGSLDGSSVGLSFRYLLGVQGREDTTWEFTNADDTSTHNIYKGVARSGVSEATAADPTSINALCGQCHGAFHREGNDAYGIVEGVNGTIGGATPSQWIRHPTDYDMPLTVGSEYAAYTTYRVQTPVGTTTPGNTIDVTTAGNRIVLCVSCHRAHGSPHADILRWDYGTMLTGASAVGETGCFACHTAKD